MTALPPTDVMVQAFLAKDPSFDGLFFAAVRTTGIFCRPTCRAKPARPENLEFFKTAAEAIRNGYRPCKLCQPAAPAGERGPRVVTRLLDLLGTNSNDIADRLTESDLRAAGIDPTTARRQFKARFGVTFTQYQRARRLAPALDEVRAGGSVALAQVGAGFRSGSGFREAFSRTFGAAASRAADVTVLTVGRVDTPLGMMHAVAADDGLARLVFLDEQGPGITDAQLAAQFGTAGKPAPLLPTGDHPVLSLLRMQLGEYFAGARRDFTVPLAVRGGGPFRASAWNFLRSIPYGETRSYGQQAAAIGSPRAVRAIGQANGSNPIAILVPCHRVIGANGSLTGYAAGVARKRWLLAHEQAVLRGGPAAAQRFDGAVVKTGRVEASLFPEAVASAGGGRKNRSVPHDS